MRRVLTLLALFALVLVVAGARADDRPPLPEPNFAGTVIPEPCTADTSNPFEVEQYRVEGWGRLDPADPTSPYVRYPGICQRLHFAFGPILVKPGQNDVLIEPITIEKPAYDGMVVRIRPDLVQADGTIPGIEHVHLHHGTWIQLTGFVDEVPNPAQDVFDLRDYGNGPFFASGEEKTIGDFPRGFGFPVKGTDHWDLLHMVHNATANPTSVWITYDVDYVAQAAASAAGLKPIYPIWMDVRPSSYPVFNVMRGFGGADGRCTWPAENCARHDPWGKRSVRQGSENFDPNSPIKPDGTHLRLPALGQRLGRISSFRGGTIVAIGGHVHPGGLTNEIDLIRSGQARRIHTSEAWYWDRVNRSVRTSDLQLATSWDFSMTGTGTPRYAVHVRPGDVLRSNVTYDATVQATYENMGIVMAFLVPDNADGTPAVPGAIDPFTIAGYVDASTPVEPGATTPGFNPNTTDIASCLAIRVLCDKGLPTHGHMREVEHYGGPTPATPTQLAQAPRIDTDTVHIAAFNYLPGDLNLPYQQTGIARVPMGGTLTFVNDDMGLNVYHTVTSCRYPCLGPPGTAFPLANGRSETGVEIDFDSSELGYSPSFGPAKNAIEWDLPIAAADGFAPGVYTYFCRIHPFMRGAFDVSA